MNDTTPPPGTPGNGTGSPGASPSGPGAMDRFFGWLRGLGIPRGDDRWFAGVAGGIAAKARIDPLIVRGIFVVLAILGGPGILLYLAAWLLLPDSNGRIHLEEVLRGRASAGVIVTAVILGALLVLPLLFGLLPRLFAGPFGWDLWGFVPDWLTIALGILWWAVIVPGLIIWFIVWASSGGLNRGRQAPPADTPGSPSGPQPAAAASFVAGTSGAAEGAPGQAHSARPASTPATGPAPGFEQRAEAWGQRMEEKSREWEQWAEQHHETRGLGAAHVLITLAAALLAAGATAGWAISGGHTGATALTAGLIAAVAVLGVSLIVAGIRGRSTGWVGFLSFLGVIALVFAPFSTVMPERTDVVPFGNTGIRAGADGADRGIVVVGGNTTVDLADLDKGSDPRSVDVWMLGGNVTVLLPQDHPVRVEVRLLAGNVWDQRLSETDRRQGGIFISRTIDSALGSGGAADATTVTVRLLAGNVYVEGGDYFATADPRYSNEDRLTAERSEQERLEAERAAERERQQEIEELRERLEELENAR